MANTNEDYIKERFPDGERRFFSEEPQFETRATGEESNVIEGYAAVFNSDSEDLGGFIERIAPGAFDDVLNDDTYALLNHNIDKILGRNKRNLKLTQDNKGLKYRVELPDTATAKEARTLVKEKIIDKSSFAFRTKEQKWEYSEDRSKPHRRTILKVSQLIDVSPVAGPAYQDTSVAVRSMKKEEPKVEQDTPGENWDSIIDYHKLTLR